MQYYKLRVEILTVQNHWGSCKQKPVCSRNDICTKLLICTQLSTYLTNIFSEMELTKHQQQYRLMEGDRKAYCEETQNSIRKQK